MANWKNETDRQIKGIDSDRENALKILLSIYTQYNKVCSNVRNNLKFYYEKEMEKAIGQIDIKELNKNKDGIRINLLVNAGFDSLDKLCWVQPWRIEQISGIGSETVSKIFRNLNAIKAAISKSIFIRFDPDRKEDFQTRILSDLYIIYHGKDISTRAYEIDNSAYVRAYIERIQMLSKEPKLFFRLFWSNARVEDYKQRIESLGEEMREGLSYKATELDQAYMRIKTDAQNCWDDFIINAATYYSLVEQLWPVERTNIGIGEDGDAEIKALMDKIDSTQINLSLMRTELRNYQLFGTKYIITQKRALIGDEMGLGKTIQAIAAMAHLSAEGKTVFVVVCPLSILVNWVREIEKHSNIRVDVIHGNASERKKQYNAWIGSNRIAVTTYDQVGKLPFEDLDHIDMLIVDEAHNVKNPNAQRTEFIRRLISRSERVVYMTGTPLENKLEEMRFLVSSINSAIGKSLSESEIVMNSAAYRKCIAPVYLRRVREDVLKELPELIEIEDWLTMNETEERKYEQTLLERNYMNVRRLSWNVPVTESSKAQKLREICDEAKEDSHKVLIFSFFITIIDTVYDMLRDRCVGKITGETPVNERQMIIDRFTESPAGSVLICQINTGGTGLNIQAASVVVFCEPQWKPSTEDQALSRSYRMGQTRNVMVHRLLVANSIDEHMMQTLQRKKGIFNEYAEDSVIGNANQEQSEMKEMMAYIEEEIKRRGLIDCKNTVADMPFSTLDGQQSSTVTNVIDISDTGKEEIMESTIPEVTTDISFLQNTINISQEEHDEIKTNYNAGEIDDLRSDNNISPDEMEKENAEKMTGTQEQYQWEKFYPAHCNDRNVDDMREENICLIAYESVNDQDILDALYELSNMDNRIKVFDDLTASGYKVSDYFIREYFDSEGDDLLLRHAISEFAGNFSVKTVMEFVSAGVEGDTFQLIIDRSEGSYSFRQIVDMVESVYDIKPETFKRIIGSVTDMPNYEQLAEILDCVDDELYEYIRPFVKKLPFDQRVELRDTYGL